MMEVRYCDACKKLIPLNEVEFYRSIYGSRLRYSQLELCKECYEKVDKVEKEYKNKDDKIRDANYKEYLEKMAELGIGVDEDRGV